MLLASDFVGAPLPTVPPSLFSGISEQRQLVSKPPSTPLSSSSQTTVSLDAFGNLRVIDISDLNDTLTIQSDTANRQIVIWEPSKTLLTTIPGAAGDGTHRVTVPSELVTGKIVLDTRAGSDLVNIDLAPGNLANEVVYEAGDPFTLARNTLVLSGGGTFDNANFGFTDSHRGVIDISGNATIHYSGPDQIVSGLAATHVTLDYSNTAEAILVSPERTNTLVTSTAAASVAFPTPTDILAINGGDDADDAVRISGDHKLHGGSLSISADQIAVDGSISTVARGYVELTASRSILVDNSSSIQTVDGDIRLSANIAPLAFAGNFVGILVNDRSTISSTTGNILLEGRGGNEPGRIANGGVHLSGGSLVESTGTGAAAGRITIVGQGGNPGGSSAAVQSNPAVLLSSVGTTVRSVEGDIEIRGDGSRGREGVVISAGLVLSTGTGSGAAKIAIHGTGGTGGHQDAATGVALLGRDTFVSSVDGDVTLGGKGGSSGFENHGVTIHAGTIVQSTGTTSEAANINIRGLAGPDASGVFVSDEDTAVASHSGDVHIGGEAISIADRAVIVSTGSGNTAATITIDGTSAHRRRSVYVSRARVTSVDGAIQFVGREGDDGIGSIGIASGAVISSTGSGAEAATVALSAPVVRVDGATITSMVGDMKFTGVGHGVDIGDGTVISSTGKGRLAATIAVNGIGLFGVVISGAQLSSIDGDIAITGEGTDKGYGVRFDHFSNTVISSTGTGRHAAEITIRGTGGGGVNLGSRTQLTSVDGAIEIVGESTGDSVPGVSLSDDAFISSTGTGSHAVGVTVHGTGARGGVHVAGRAQLTSVDGDIEISGMSAASTAVTISGLVASSGTGPDAADIEIEGTAKVIGVLLRGRVNSIDGALRVTANADSERNTSLYLVNGGLLAARGTGNIDVVAKDGIVVRDSTIGDSAGTGQLSLRADIIDLNRAIAIRGSGPLIISPTTVSSTIGIGGGSGTLNLDDVELRKLADGFRSITVGNATNGTGAVDVDSSTFHDPVAIVGGTIDVDQLDAQSNEVTLTARTGSISTALGRVTAPSVTGKMVWLNGDVAPGASPGPFNVDGSVTFDGSGSYSLDLDGVVNGSEYDQLRIAGPNRTVALVNADLNISLGFAPAVGAAFTIIDTVAKDSKIDGTFRALMDGSTFPVDETHFRIDYAGGADGNDVVLTVVDKPSPKFDAQLLADIGLSHFSIREITHVGTHTFFVASMSAFGQELWKTDGSSDGTVLVKDIAPGVRSSAPRSLSSVGNTLFFRADDGLHGTELWKSDGTSDGTVLVKDINPGPFGSSPASLTDVGGRLFFAANDGVRGSELWESDGSTTGTVLVRDINPGSMSSSPTSFTVVDSVVFFAASDGRHGKELWASNGSGGKTELVKDINPGSNGSRLDHLTAFGGALFFAASDGIRGTELWTSDGNSAGTYVVNEIQPGSGSSYPSALTDVDGTLYFLAWRERLAGLWKSDGTSDGTVLVRGNYVGFGSQLNSITHVGKTLFFMAHERIHGAELWKSDGTSAGTELVRDIYPGSRSSFLEPVLTNVDGTLFFAANDGIHGSELWKSDGTSEGTVLFHDINPGPESSRPESLTSVGSSLFFAAANTGIGLYTTNGNEAGTRLATFGSNRSSAPNSFVRFENSTFFATNDISGLWKTDGSDTGTVLIKTLSSSSRFYPLSLTKVGDTLYFADGDDLWKSDGTSDGTVLVKANVEHHAGFLELVNVDDTLFFNGYEGADGPELWKSDGTANGTVRVKDIHPGRESSYPDSLTNLNGTLFFTAGDGVHGWELWKSDGTSAGTVLVKDISPGRSNSLPRSLTVVGDTLFFVAGGRELWRSDGTSTGTVLVKDIGPARSYLKSLTDVDGTLFFTADDGIHGTELWKSDGTSRGTVLVKDIYPGLFSSLSGALSNVGGMLFFEANDGIHGSELWKSDGTSAGTVLVKDIFRGPASSRPDQITQVLDTLFFTADDGIHGREVWKSDGNRGDTELVVDIYPGSGSSGASSLANVSGTLFFAADNGATGLEPWFVTSHPRATSEDINGIGNENRSRVASLTIQFNQAVTVSRAGALTVINQTTGTLLDTAAAELHSNGTSAVTWDFSTVGLPDGFYTAELPRAEAVNVVGKTLTSSHAILFHKLAGDGSGDRQVGFADVALLANHFNTINGPKLGPGDLDGNGDVDFRDLSVLSGNFNESLFVPAMDFGDAPETATSYATTVANNGARHVLGAGLFLGSGVDGEPDGQANADADGDGADEDGVVFAALRIGGDASVGVTATGGVLNAWIDFNADGDWDDGGEHVFIDRALNNGVNNLTVAVPSTASVGSTLARFRVTGSPGYSYTGLAPDGEVEDYRVTLVAGFTSNARIGARTYSGRRPAHELPAASLLTAVGGYDKIAAPRRRDVSLSLSWSDRLPAFAAAPNPAMALPLGARVNYSYVGRTVSAASAKGHLGISSLDGDLVDQVFEEGIDGLVDLTV